MKGKPSGNKKNRLLLVILGFAFAVRLAFGVYYAHFDSGAPQSHIPLLSQEGYFEAFRDDSACYNQLAQQILRGEKPMWKEKPFSLFPPLYPLFLCACYGLFGFNFLAILIPQVVLSTLTGWFLFKIGGTLFNSSVGTIAATFFAVYPRFILYCALIMTETLYLFLLAFLLWMLVRRPFPKKKIWEWASLGALIGLAALCRSVVLIFFPFILFGIGWALRRQSGWKTALFVLLCFSIIYFPRSIWNMVLYHNDALLRQANLLWRGNNPAYRDMKFLELDRYVTKNSEMRSYETPTVPHYRLKAFFRWLGQHPGEYVSLCLRRLVHFALVPVSFGMSMRHKLVSGLSFLALFPLGYWGWWKALKMKDIRVQLLVLFVPVNILFHSLTYLEETFRYRLPVELVLVVFASLAVWILLHRWQGKTVELAICTK